jgi:hypothetical protein
VLGANTAEIEAVVAKMDKGVLMGGGPKKFCGNCGGDISGKQVGYFQNKELMTRIAHIFHPRKPAAADFGSKSKCPSSL